MRAKESENDVNVQSNLYGSDEVEQLLQTVDWSKTSLGEIDTWSESLHSAALTLLREFQFKESLSGEVEYRHQILDGSTVYSRDITAQQQCAVELADLSQLVKRQSDLFNTVLSTVSDHIFVFDCEGRFLFINQTVQDILGLAQDEIVGKTMAELNYPREVEENVLKSIQQVFRTGEMVKNDTFFKSPITGESGFFEYILSPLFAFDGMVESVVGSSRNITDRKQAELTQGQLLKQEQATRAEAERANRIKDEFLAILSHELRTPLSPILGWTKILRHVTLSEDKVNKALETIERNVKLQVQLIDDLLDLSRILQGKLNLNYCPVRLPFVISAALETVRLSLDAKALHLTLNIDDTVAPVLGDAGRLQQVVWNVLSNAIKFTPPKGEIEVNLQQVGHEVQIQVRDTGKGIHPNFLPHVFEHFQQEDNQATTRQFGGLGLGLAIAKQLVELHGGTIGVESPGEGQGATFTIALPLSAQSSAQEESASYND
jgi:PAS domain S-box-containing protein